MADLTAALVEAGFNDLLKVLRLAAEFIEISDPDSPILQGLVIAAVRDGIMRLHSMRGAIVAELNRCEAVMKETAPAGQK